MIKKLLFILSILFLFSSCASDSTGEFPLWVSSDWKNSFPDSEYLSSRGISSSAELSKTEALSQIARYINTSVNSNLLTSVRSINKGGEIDESTLIQNDVAVKRHRQSHDKCNDLISHLYRALRLLWPWCGSPRKGH